MLQNSKFRKLDIYVDINSVVLGEELMIDIEDVQTVNDRGIAFDILQEGMEILQKTIETYPLHIQVWCVLSYKYALIHIR